MARFSFRLQRLLALREAEARQAKFAAAGAAAVARERERQLEQSAAMVRAAAEPLRAPEAKTVSGAELSACAAYLDRVRDEEARAAGRLREAQEVQARAMALARQAWGDAEVLSALRARLQQYWEAAGLAAEQRMVDDLAVAAGRRQQPQQPQRPQQPQQPQLTDRQRLVSAGAKAVSDGRVGR